MIAGNPVLTLMIAGFTERIDFITLELDFPPLQHEINHFVDLEFIF
jgi:hypothetical protein